MTSPSRSLTSGSLLARNVALNLGGWLLPAIAALIAVPLLVRGLGDARFGVLALAWTALGYFSLFDLGIGRAVTHAVADRLGRDQEHEIGAVMWTSLGVLLPVGVAGAVVLFAGAPWLTHRLLQVPVELRDETVLSFRILAIAIPFAGITAALRGALEAKQLFGAVNALRVPHGLLVFLGPVVALAFSRSLVPAMAILAVGRALLCAAHFWVCARAIPHFSESEVRWSRESLRHLLSFGGWMTVSNIISPLMNTLDRFVVGAVLSVSVVTYYAAPNELVTKMWLFTAALHPVFFPALATAATRDTTHAATLFGRLLRVTFAGLFLPTLLLVLLAPDILRIWLGAAFAERSTTVLQVLAIAVFVNTLGQGGLTLIQSFGRPDITGKYHAVELPFYAAALWLLLPRFGILGVALAWGARAIVDAVLLLLTCPVLLKETRGVVTRTVWWTAAAVAVFGLGMTLSSSPVRVAIALLAIPAWGAVAWRWIFTRRERSAPARMLSEAWPTASG